MTDLSLGGRDGASLRSFPGRMSRDVRRESVARRVLDKDGLVRRVDWLLMVGTIGLCAIGAALIWSATKNRTDLTGPDHAAILKKDVLNLVIGTGLGIGATLINYRALRAYAPIVYVASILGLLAVLTPGVGATINGAHSWIRLPAGFEVQPAEFSKIALAVGMAMLLGQKGDDKAAGPGNKDIMLALALAAVPAALIMAQPDLGTTVVLAFIVLGGLAMSGAPLRWVGGLFLAGVLGITVLLNSNALSAYQQARLTNFANPSANVTSSGYNVAQAKLAIGSGGVTGQGLGNGKQTTGQFVPEQQTDFVFTVAGEELGFVGSIGLLALFGLVLYRAVRIASRSQDAFGTILAGSIACWWAFQGFINVGMTLGIMPVTGLPLPFVSYGGSAMFVNLVGIGLLQSVHLQSSERVRG